MLPSIVLEEIFANLRSRQLKELRFACREFDCLILPSLIRRFALKVAGSDASFSRFLQRHGRHVRRLEIVNLNILLPHVSPNLKLSQLFTNLCSLSIRSAWEFSNFLYRSLAEECLRLRHLKHLSLRGKCKRNLLEAMEMVIVGLESITISNGRGFYDYISHLEFKNLISLTTYCNGFRLRDLMRIKAPQLQDLTILCKEQRYSTKFVFLFWGRCHVPKLHFQNLLGWKALSERQLSDGTLTLMDLLILFVNSIELKTTLWDISRVRDSNTILWCIDFTTTSSF